MSEESNSSFWSILVWAVTGVIGFLVGRFQGRLVRLRYWTIHSNLGSSVNSSQFGSVQITHNGILVNSLYLSTLTVENPSNKDLQNLKIVLYCDTPSTILVSHATKRGDLSDISFDQEFVSFALANPDLNVPQKRREYRIPVLNRHQLLDFKVLVTNANAQQPFVWASCEHTGLKLDEVKWVHRFWGEPRDLAAVVGLLFALIACYPIYKYLVPFFATPNVGVITSIILASLLGSLCLIPGVMILKIYGYIRKIFV